MKLGLSGYFLLNRIPTGGLSAQRFSFGGGYFGGLPVVIPAPLPWSKTSGCADRFWSEDQWRRVEQGVS